MKKLFFCITLVLTGLMTACVDKNQVVDEDSKPEWLGESIYQELTAPTQLTGTFSTYLRLINDLGYAETLNRTGSKTVFPANDEAFGRFFQSNPWGVTSYEQLTTAQKKMLLYSSMLDNALLVSMFSNVSSGDYSVTRGMAMKHQTNLSLIDSIQHVNQAELLPQNNKYWDDYRATPNMYLVSDGTTPMMLHFTREHMLSQGITTLGNESDFAIITGTPYQDGMAYIFDDQIVNSDVTCQNGYIHQMKDVIVPPGNMAQTLRADKETSLFSRMIDYFSAPYENKELTDRYNAWAQEQRPALPTIDMIYEMRYFNNDGHHRLNYDPNKSYEGLPGLLKFDPGWNQYSPKVVDNGIDFTISDVGAIFAPTDEAVKKFFTKGGEGAYIIDLYGKYINDQNTPEHIQENMDALFNQKPEIVKDFINNLMEAEFTQTVPSKFSTMLTDGNEYKGIELGIIQDRADGRKDIKIANNGVIYKLTQMLSPDKYQSVWAPATIYDDMSVMNWAVGDDATLGISFHYYLMAMKANYGFFIPDDAAFLNEYYVDPIYLGHDEPRVLKFSYDAAKKTLSCKAYRYNPETGQVGSILKEQVPVSEWRSLMIDILNYHTVVLEDGETLGTNNFYQTKHGGAVRVTGNTEGAKVMSGQQIDNGVPASTITKVYNEKNGTAFRIDHVIQAPRNSVSKTLSNYPTHFHEFYNLCRGFTAESELMEWAGISSKEDPTFKISPQDAYIIFTSENKSQAGRPIGNCLDENVKMFNTYHYTLYAPNNSAMQMAYNAGLPTWDEIRQIKEDAEDNDLSGDALEREQEKARDMIDMLRNFTRYHFQSNAVYADNKVATSPYNSLCSDNLGLAIQLQVSGGGGVLTVTDATGQAHQINANNSTMLSNLMARDYWFNAPKANASDIYTSSFCVVHELSTPLNPGNIGIQWGAATGRKLSTRK